LDLLLLRCVYWSRMSEKRTSSEACLEDTDSDENRAVRLCSNPLVSPPGWDTATNAALPSSSRRKADGLAWAGSGPDGSNPAGRVGPATVSPIVRSDG